MHALHKVLLLLVLACLGQNALGSEIINGENAKKNSMLYMASLQNNGHHVCGGFLVSEDFVMTAAHCDNWNPTSVVLGTHNLEEVDDTMRYSFTKYKHPDYKNVVTGNDIMLLKLSKKARLDNRVKPIQLPTGKTKLKDKAKCRVAGWGYNESDGKVVNELQAVEVPVVKLEECKREWKQNRIDLPNNVICAGGYLTMKGFCQGDSGGPLVYREKAVGVVSFNFKKNCDYPNIPNVYTDISKYVQWIKRILKLKRC